MTRNRARNRRFRRPTFLRLRLRLLHGRTRRRSLTGRAAANHGGGLQAPRVEDTCDGSDDDLAALPDDIALSDPSSFPPRTTDALPLPDLRHSPPPPATSDVVAALSDPSPSPLGNTNAPALTDPRHSPPPPPTSDVPALPSPRLSAPPPATSDVPALPNPPRTSELSDGLSDFDSGSSDSDYEDMVRFFGRAEADRFRAEVQAKIRAKTSWSDLDKSTDEDTDAADAELVERISEKFRRFKRESEERALERINKQRSLESFGSIDRGALELINKQNEAEELQSQSVAKSTPITAPSIAVLNDTISQLTVVGQPKRHEFYQKPEEIVVTPEANSSTVEPINWASLELPKEHPVDEEAKAVIYQRFHQIAAEIYGGQAIIETGSKYLGENCVHYPTFEAGDPYTVLEREGEPVTVVAVTNMKLMVAEIAAAAFARGWWFIDDSSVRQN